jgi:hypothetical protein
MTIEANSAAAYDIDVVKSVRSRMKSVVAAALLVMAMAGPSVAANEVPPMSAAQLQKVLKFVDTIGGKQEFPPPTAQSLGLSSDPNQKLPVTVVVTDDHTVLFCRSDLNPADYIIWVRSPDNKSAYMFLTHADLKPVRAIYLRTEAFPTPADIASSQVQGVFRNALAALAKDIEHSASH